MRTVAIGLDGTSWNVLEPLLESGELPHLSALRARAASGTLESTVPFYTGPAWASFATASSPGTHGVYDFMMLRAGDVLTPASDRDLRRVTYYDLLAQEGRRSIVVNLPLDQGLREGVVVVNSWLTVDDDRRLYPVELRDDYREQLAGYRSYPTTFSAPLQIHLEDLCELEASRFELARELFLREEWEHFFVLFSATDWLGHKALGLFLAGDAEARAAFSRLYRQLDAYVGWFVEQAPDALVAVLSDHGQCAETHVFHVNGVLRQLGLVQALRERPRDANALLAGEEGPRATIEVPQALRRLRSVPALRAAARRLRRFVRSKLNVELLTPQRALDVDRILSRAFTPTIASYAVYTRDCDPVELERIRSALLDVTLEDGRPALSGVWTFEELYGRPAPPGGPSLVFAPSLGVRPTVALRTPVTGPAPEAGRGAHQRDGILLLAGPHVAAGDLGRPTIYDVTPTLLAAMDAPLPARADGRVLYEAFEPEFAGGLEPREVDADVEPGGEPSSGSEQVEARLRALGYL